MPSPGYIKASTLFFLVPTEFHFYNILPFHIEIIRVRFSGFFKKIGTMFKTSRNARRYEEYKIFFNSSLTIIVPEQTEKIRMIFHYLLQHHIHNNHVIPTDNASLIVLLTCFHIPFRKQNFTSEPFSKKFYNNNFVMWCFFYF